MSENESVAPDGVAETLARYATFGGKASGGAGDEACGVWLESELAGLGFTVERQGFAAPFFEATQADLAIDGATADVIPQAVAVPTGPDGVEAPLALAEDVRPGVIALIVLPHARWSTATAPPVRTRIAAAFAGGARAAVLITTGPTGEAIALNAPAEGESWPGPVAVLAPRAAGPFLEAAQTGRPARLTLSGAGGQRPCFNLIGRRTAGTSKRTLVISTPRSGWFDCAGERGPGVAVWLALARRLAARPPDADLLFLCTSGHEYENLGSAAFLPSASAPAPGETALWLHLGANVAARDWHELGGALAPLPSADPQRFLAVDGARLETARRLFAGLAGLENPYDVTQRSAGEATEIVKAGHGAVAALFGAHRYHHVQSDDGRCVEPDLTQAVVGPCEALVRAALEG